VTPRISVVLPVHNGAPHLARTIESILGQSEGDLELIAVDDGSSDATGSILTAYASRDPRVRVVTQAHGGVTRALIRGCELVTGPLIARQDCGDLSHPERLKRMLLLFAEHPSCVLAASEVEFIGPGGETLFTTSHALKDIRGGLLRGEVNEISLPAHPAAVMRADAYRQTGGYRSEFYFAQDLDLFVRMAVLGNVHIEPEALYQASIRAGTISNVYGAQQLASATIAVALRDVLDDAKREALLSEVAAIRPTPVARARNKGSAGSADYFIAACLRQRHDPRWQRYATRAVSHDPLHLRAWLLLIRGVLG
jgi:glycosyltransferase involved in cell wall biosynthesis